LNNCGEWAGTRRRNDPDVEAEFLFRPEREVHEPIGVFLLTDRDVLGLGHRSFDVARRRRHAADVIILENRPHLLLALFHLLGRRHLRAIVHHERIRHFLADRQLIRPGQIAQGGLDFRQRNLARIGTIGEGVGGAASQRSGHHGHERDAEKAKRAFHGQGSFHGVGWRMRGTANNQSRDGVFPAARKNQRRMRRG
jgi:hypothetical protein